MRPLQSLAHEPASTPLVADDVLEFHVARMLLLFKLCGVKGGIDGLTKMAKLDFFVRYPDFFSRACQTAGLQADGATGPVESRMARHHYGPWDKRYYRLLAYLRSTGLLTVSKEGSSYQLRLTEAGLAAATRIEQEPAFEGLCRQMASVKRAFGSRSGSALKKLIYRTFDQEVASRPLGEMID